MDMDAILASVDLLNRQRDRIVELEVQLEVALVRLDEAHKEIDSMHQAITDPENKPSQYGTVLVKETGEQSVEDDSPANH